jgi:hypothetical protein
MKTFADSEDPPADALERTGQCGECGATTRVGQDLCANCLLRQGLETAGEASAEAFERDLEEAKVPDAHWRLGNIDRGLIWRGGMGVIAPGSATPDVLSRKSGSGLHASAETLVSPAEAAARLDVNILPIYGSVSEDGLVLQHEIRDRRESAGRRGRLAGSA